MVQWFRVGIWIFRTKISVDGSCDNRAVFSYEIFKLWEFHEIIIVNTHMNDEKIYESCPALKYWEKGRWQAESQINEWVEGIKTITIVCKDGENELENLLKYIKNSGNKGHSFSIIVDPEDEGKKFYWDGDGADTIKDIKVENSHE